MCASYKIQQENSKDYVVLQSGTTFKVTAVQSSPDGNTPLVKPRRGLPLLHITGETSRLPVQERKPFEIEQDMGTWSAAACCAGVRKKEYSNTDRAVTPSISPTESCSWVPTSEKDDFRLGCSDVAAMAFWPLTTVAGFV